MITKAGLAERLLRVLPVAACLAQLLLWSASFLLQLGDFSNGKRILWRNYDFTGRVVLQNMLAMYLAVLHVIAFLCAIRLCYAQEQTTRNIKIIHSQGQCSKGAVSGSSDLIHVIMLPSYKEDIDTLRDTLDMLASHHLAEAQYDVYLAMEMKDPNAVKQASVLIDAYQGKFHDMQYTIHPADIGGEAQGKSSNISWAARQALEKHRNLPTKTETIFTVMDADTHLCEPYFSQIAQLHHSETDAWSKLACLYMPPFVFDRNAHKVPAAVRICDLTWCGGTISGIYPNSSICIPASVYSVSLPLVELAGGWDAGPEAIGEDMHMFLKCFFATRGTLKVKPVYSPASQSNVCSDLSGLVGYHDGMRARWRQALRHMWGSLDTGYSITRGFELLWNEDRGGLEAAPKPSIKTFVRFMQLYLRMFEAHLLPLQIMLVLVCSNVFTFIVPQNHTTPLLRTALIIASHLRTASYITMICWFLLYERYHSLCVSLRHAQVVLADKQFPGMYERASFSYRHGWRYRLECFAFPIAGMLFASLPAFVAQTCHLWTNRLTYRVSAKPARKLIKVSEVVEEFKTGHVIKEFEIHE